MTELELIEWEREQEARARRAVFHRVEVRHSSRRRGLDCGHVIDRTEPYRYQVWKELYTPGVAQRRDCDPCARRDARY